MKKMIFILFVLFFIFASCSNSDPVLDFSTPTNATGILSVYDKDGIHSLNNALDTLVMQFDKVFSRSNKETMTGIIGVFQSYVKDTSGSYSYTYNFSNDGTYRVVYSENAYTSSGSDGYSVPYDSGSFSLSLKNSFFYITLYSSKGAVKVYRYLISENFLAFLDSSDETVYGLELDDATYKYNAEDDELSEISHYTRESGYNGILGKWTCHFGESFSTSGYDLYGYRYYNTYWPITYQIEFTNDGLFTFKKIELSKESGNNNINRKENIIQGVFGVVETAENDFQIGLVSYSKQKVLTHFKVSKHYLTCEKSLGDIIGVFTVSYYSDVGTVPESIKLEENAFLSSNHLPKLSCKGYIFNGWSISDKIITSNMISIKEDIVLYAKWTKLCCVQYSTDYGTAPDSFFVKPNSVLTSAQLPSLYDENNYFLGWYCDSTLVEADKFTITNDVIFTASWIDDMIYWNSLTKKQDKIRFVAKKLKGTWLLHGTDDNYKLAFSESSFTNKYFMDGFDYTQGTYFDVMTRSVYSSSNYRWENVSSYQIFSYTVIDGKLRFKKTNNVEVNADAEGAFSVEEIKSFILTGKGRHGTIRYFPYPYGTSYGNDEENLYFVKKDIE